MSGIFKVRKLSYLISLYLKFLIVPIPEARSESYNFARFFFFKTFSQWNFDYPWDTFRSHANTVHWSKFVWLKHIPLKIYFGWKLMKRVLPVDLKLTDIGIHMVSRCICCSQPFLREKAVACFIH